MRKITDRGRVAHCQCMNGAIVKIQRSVQANLIFKTSINNILE